MCTKNIWISLIAFSTSITLAAQQTPYPIISAEKQTLHSNILNEDREIYIYSPNDSTIKRPLILVFDAETLFETVVNTNRFMNAASEIPQMPEALVVGIPNTKRNRDMPVPQEYGKGGEERFMNFIKDELLPELTKKYPLNGHIILIGHSQGGLFVTYMQTKFFQLFPWVIALDAPMTVTTNINQLKKDFGVTIKKQNDRLRYVSAEAVYGWDNELSQYLTESKNTLQVKLVGETHQSMPLKGIYEGLKFLYRDYSPADRSLTLTQLKEYYQGLSDRYGYLYDIPLAVLYASISRNLKEDRKKEVLEIISYAEQKYGTNLRIERMKEEASRITKEPDPRIDHYLALSKPSVDDIKPFLGRWKGTMFVPGGMDMPCEWEFLVEEGIVKMINYVPWAAPTPAIPVVFHVTKENELIIGRRNGGGGIYIATCKLTKTDRLTGKEILIGFKLPDDAPDDAKRQFKIGLEDPPRLDLKKE